MNTDRSKEDIPPVGMYYPKDTIIKPNSNKGFIGYPAKMVQKRASRDENKEVQKTLEVLEKAAKQVEKA